MPSINGVKVKIQTNSIPWSATTDNLYLGIYSSKGGREFRLNLGLEFDNSSSTYEFGLGQTCCSDGSLPLVAGSTGLNPNDPMFNPIELFDVDFVYIRKATSNLDVNTDDAMVLDSVSVLLCDVDGNLRNFCKKENIWLADEVGLQHWLTEGSPPKCKVTLSFDKVSHEKIGKRSVGNSWVFNFRGYLGGQVLTVSNNWDTNLKPGKNILVNAKSSIEAVGCCGQDYILNLVGIGREKDWPGPDDIGSTSTNVKINCSHEPQVIDSYIEFDVHGDNKNRKSRIRYDYRITTECISGDC